MQIETETSIPVLSVRFGKFHLAIPVAEPYVYYATFFAGEWDHIDIRKGDVVLDAGSNVGDFAIKASKSVGPTGLVIAVEPSHTALGILYQNLRLNRSTNVVVSDAYLSGEAGDVWIRDTGTYVTHAAPGESGATRREKKPVGQLLRELGVHHVDVLKMDIEGAEASVLNEEKLLDSIREMGIEIHGSMSHELLCERLRNAGFSVRTYGGIELARNFLNAVIRHFLCFIESEVKFRGYAVRALLTAVLREVPIPALQKDSGIRIVYGRRTSNQSRESPKDWGGSLCGAKD